MTMPDPAAAAPAAVEVEWRGGLRFEGGRPGGPTLQLDGEREGAPSPVEGVVVALAACAGVDVVDILEKRRTPARSLRVRAEFERAAEPPRRLLEIRLAWEVDTDSERAHVERAIQLSFDKYCSVSHSLAADLRLSWTLQLGSPGAG